ncbi:MAG: hypothetical protein C4526_12650 [Nitrospiraceae bacterium]|nr:MAG: hypothetical protein C4526_12650 [Nitrospiraceae bacterium]
MEQSMAQKYPGFKQPELLEVRTTFWYVHLLNFIIFRTKESGDKGSRHFFFIDVSIKKAKSAKSQKLS